MKVKKVFLSVAIIALVIAIMIPQAVFATVATTPKYLGITELRTNDTPNFGYAIGDPNSNGMTGRGAKIWNILEYTGDGSDASLKADGSKNIYCVKAGVGFSDTQKRAIYNEYYDDMKTKRDEIKAQNDVLRSIVEGTVPYGEETVSKYDALLALGDMLYFIGDSTEQEKTTLLQSAGIDVSDYTVLLTGDDIAAVQQAAIWYFTNYGEENGKYDKTSNTAWLNYTIDGNSYTSLADYIGATGNDGRQRQEQAEILYNYLINTAKANANNYSPTEETQSSTAPAKLVTTKLNYTMSGNDYIVGPIRINETEGNTMPYDIDFFVNKTYKLLNSGKQEVAQGTTVKDLVGQDFYISVSNIDDIEVTVDIKYANNKLVLWASSTNNQEQPVMIPEKHIETKPVKLTLESKSFDLALRKYITKITSNGTTKVLSDTADTRVPNIDESVISEDKTASYQHRKDPVSIQTGDIVTYNITIYNEGEKAGRATKVIDQLPTGLKFKQVVSGNFDADSSYSESGDNKLVLNRKANNTNNLPAYQSGNLTSGRGSETIEIECEVTATPDTKNKKVLTNVAWISEEIDENGTVITNQVGLDRDSEPATHPDVNKDNMSNYQGSTNKPLVSESGKGFSDWFYKGQQDDDDFEKLVLNPKEFDLKLVKYISALNGDTSKGKTVTKIDTSKLNTLDSNGNKITTAEYTLSKNVVAVKYGDYVTYTFRVYNEGDINGYLTKLTDNIPLGLQFVQAKNDGKTITIYSYSAENGITSEDKIVDNDTYDLVNRNNGHWTIDKNGENIKTDTYDGDVTPSISLDVENYLGGTNKLLEAYDASIDINKDGANLKYVDATVVLRVSEEAELNKVIRNEAAITGHTDEDGNAIEDRDSQPENWPGKDDHTKYQDDEDYDNIILKPFDLALRKFIIAVSDDETIQNSEYLKDTEGKYLRAPKVDTSKLNTIDSTTGKLITTATYNHPKQPVEVKKGDIVVYTLRVYNEGDIDGYAAEIKDHLPANLEFVNGNYNRQYGWTISEDGRTVTTKYLENELIRAAQLIVGGTQPYTLSYKEVPIMCKVKDTAKVDEKITNIADITKYLDDNKQSVTDRDSQEDNVNATEGNKPDYKDTEINRGDEYIPGQQDDDDFEKVIIPRFDLALRKQITSIYNAFNKKETKYNNRYAKLDNSRSNTIYDYYDVESNIPTVVENDVVTYSIRVYNEGKVDGTATWITDRLPSGLEYLPENETNKKFGWKAFKLSTATAEKAVKIGEKYYEEVGYDSKDIYMYATEYLKDSTIKAYTGEGEATYGEVFMTTRVKAKSEVAQGTEYKLRNIAEIGDDDNDDDDSVPGDESEWKDQDDVDIEDLKLVEFDLALRKWVTQAIVIDSKGQTVTETGHQPYDDPEQVVKVELHRRKLNEVTVKFRYSIRIINEGDIAGYAKEIKDYIPQGLKFVAEDNPGWKDEGDNLISTTLLENTLLQPGEFADVEVLLTWINSQDNMGVMVNTAEISKDYNEYGVKDRDSTPDNKKWGEDDIDDAPVMLSISTGQMRIYFTLGFVVLITIAGGVVLIKKYVL